MIQISSSTTDVSVDLLVDLFMCLCREFSELGATRGEFVTDFLERNSKHARSILSSGVKPEDFETISVLGRGAFGEVRLVKKKKDGKVFAMKLMRKSKLRGNKSAAGFKEERDVMATSDTPWITRLYYAFQDSEFLYLVMEYIQGGNLLTQLYKDDVFDEDTARFYIAETILAVNAVHELGYIHRDVKPENLMIDSKGHIKITDFGTCIKFNESGEVKVDTSVGTPEYISPEMLQAQGKGAFIGKSADWWSVGIIIFEMLFGEVPFYSDSQLQMYGLILNFLKPNAHIPFPEDIEVSEEVKDLCKKLICKREDRLDFEGIKNHPFFKDINWDTLRESKPPFVPEIQNELDTSHFEVDEDTEDPLKDSSPKRKVGGFVGEGLPFIGFSYSRENFKITLGAPSYSKENEFDNLKKIALEKEKKIDELEAQSDELVNEIESLKQGIETEQNQNIRLSKNIQHDKTGAKQARISGIWKVASLKVRLDDTVVKKREIERKLFDVQMEISGIKQSLQDHLRSTREAIEAEINSRKSLEAAKKLEIAELDAKHHALVDQVEGRIQGSKEKSKVTRHSSTLNPETVLKVLEERLLETKREHQQKIDLKEKEKADLEAEMKVKKEKLEEEITVLKFRVNSLAKKLQVETNSKEETSSKVKKLKSDNLKMEKDIDEQKEGQLLMVDKLDQRKQKIEKAQKVLEEMKADKLASSSYQFKALFKEKDIRHFHYIFEGYLKVKRFGAKYSKFGFKKLYVFVKDYNIYILNKEEEKKDLSKATTIIDLKSSILIVSSAPKEYLKEVSQKMEDFVFAVYEKEGETYNPNIDLLEIDDGSKKVEILPKLFMTSDVDSKGRWITTLQNLRTQYIMSS